MLIDGWDFEIVPTEEDKQGQMLILGFILGFIFGGLIIGGLKHRDVKDVETVHSEPQMTTKGDG